MMVTGYLSYKLNNVEMLTAKYADLL